MFRCLNKSILTKINEVVCPLCFKLKKTKICFFLSFLWPRFIRILDNLRISREKHAQTWYSKNKPLENMICLATWTKWTLQKYKWQNNIKLVLAVQPKVRWLVFKYIKHVWKWEGKYQCLFWDKNQSSVCRKKDLC